MVYGPVMPFAQELHAAKYRAINESFEQCATRQADALKDGEDHFRAYRDILLDQRFLPGGRVQNAMGSPRIVTPYNCFVSGVIRDSMSSIMKVLSQAGDTMRLGGGVGYDFSRIRFRGAPIASLGSQATGPVEWMELYNAMGGVLRSVGERKGAQMAILRIDHPDIEEFVQCKQNEHRFRNFNISVGVTDAFMQALAADSSFDLTFGGKRIKTIRATALWDMIMRSTWEWAEPGVVFLDTINRMNNLWYCERIEATNPCFTGDTLVWTAYGPRRLDELAKSGRSIPVLTQDADGKIVYRDMVRPRRTRRNQRLVRVVMGRGNDGRRRSYVECTPNHVFFLKDGRAVRADELIPGDRIYSVYRHKANSKGRTRLSGAHHQPLAHHVAAEYRHGRWPTPHEDVHHVDEDKSNDAPDNVEIKSSSLHRSQHIRGDRNPVRRFPERNVFCKGFSGTDHGKWRHDIDTKILQKLRRSGLSFAAISRQVNMSKYGIARRLGYTRPDNHRVIEVIRLERRADVYCGTVPSTGRFFVQCADGEGVLVSNCGEQPLPAHGACLLGSLNLVKYVRTGQSGRILDLMGLDDDLYHIVRAMDNIVDRAVYPMKEQRESAEAKRRMGIGVTGLANAIEACGHPYGSPGFMIEANRVMVLVRNHSYRASVELAREKGAFPAFKAEEYLSGPFIQSLPSSIQEDIERHGIRNSHLTSCAPTGTISLSADNVSSGIEPVIFLEQKRVSRMPDGDREVVIEDYGKRVFGTIGKTSVECTAEEHLSVLLMAQRHVDSAVSKTCNIDDRCSWDDFKGLYVKAWEGGAKGLTTFNPSGRRGAVVRDVRSNQPVEGSACKIAADGTRTCE